MAMFWETQDNRRTSQEAIPKGLQNGGIPKVISVDAGSDTSQYVRDIFLRSYQACTSKSCPQQLVGDECSVHLSAQPYPQ
jgi:hypothetical protein